MVASWGGKRGLRFGVKVMLSLSSMDNSGTWSPLYLYLTVYVVEGATDELF